MPPFRRWADLLPDLVCRIGDSLDLESYASARGACPAWRRALAPPSPSVLLTKCCACAASLPAHRSFELKHIPLGARCVGSSNGWLALCLTGNQSTLRQFSIFDPIRKFSLFNPFTAAEILLPPLVYQSGWVSKIVFAPGSVMDDFAAVAICDEDMLAYATAGARRWAILDPISLARGDQLVDIVYHEKGMFYIVTRYGDVHVLRLPDPCRRKPNAVKDPAVPLSSAKRAAQRKRRRIQQVRRFHDPDTVMGPHLNAPASLKPLLSEHNLPFDHATSFAPPYNTISGLTSAKNLVFVEGNLYQIWRNTSCTVSLQLPGGGRRRVEENEIFVLRYYPQRRPCWDAVTDLGGYSVFVGRNNAVSMYAQTVTGLKGNCVYWIGGRRDRDQGMVFDMATRRSAPCLRAALQCAICWYFLNDTVNNCSNGGKRVHQTRARSKAQAEK